MTGKYMQHSDLDFKRIAVLLSGGVDSSVVVYEFAKLGLHPDCFYIKIGPEEEEERLRVGEQSSGIWDCSSEEDLEMATAVAHKYGCNLEVIDCHREYWDQVTRYTMEKVRAGFTPNPDVMCNRLIKFGAFDEKRGHDYDLIATGHYAQTELDEAGRKWLVTSPDPVKDQTDFLAQIYDWQLRKAIVFWVRSTTMIISVVTLVKTLVRSLNLRRVVASVNTVVSGSIPSVSARVWAFPVAPGSSLKRMFLTTSSMSPTVTTLPQPTKVTSLCMTSIG